MTVEITTPIRRVQAGSFRAPHRFPWTGAKPPGPVPGGLAGMKGFEPSVSALTGQRVGPLHHTPRQPEVYHVAKASVKRTQSSNACGTDVALCIPHSSLRGSPAPWNETGATLPQAWQGASNLTPDPLSAMLHPLLSDALGGEGVGVLEGLGANGPQPLYINSPPPAHSPVIGVCTQAGGGERGGGANDTAIFVGETHAGRAGCD
jgi:hypothetical protein